MIHQNETDERRPNANRESADPSGNVTIRKVGTTSVIVIGSSASIESSNAATDGASTSSAEAESAPERLVLVPIDDYLPGTTVRVVKRLPAPIVIELLRLPNDETVPVLRRPDEYTGYVVRAEPDPERIYSTSFLFTRESLETDASYRFAADAQMFSTRLNLLRATVRGADADSDADADEGVDGSEEGD